MTCAQEGFQGNKKLFCYVNTESSRKQVYLLKSSLWKLLVDNDGTNEYCIFFPALGCQKCIRNAQAA